MCTRWAFILVMALWVGCDSKPSPSASQPGPAAATSPAAQSAAGATNVTTQAAPSTAGADLLYREDFQRAGVGSIPEDFLVLEGEFAVKDLDGNRIFELPGEPLSTFGFLFGPSAADGVAVRARFNGTRRGRRYPSFGVGLGGTTGYRLMVFPGKETLELHRGEEPKAEAAYQWTSETWTHLLLQVRKTGEGRWRVEGKAWSQAVPEPAGWTVGLDAGDPPPSGRASAWGSPFAGTPIQFDDLSLARVAGASAGAGARP